MRPRERLVPGLVLPFETVLLAGAIVVALVARVRVLAVALAVALLATAAASGGDGSEARKVLVEGSGGYTEVGPAGLVRMLETKGFTLMNVHIPFDQIAAHLDRLPADRGARVVVYCRSGRMGAIAARTLVTLGYRDVWNVEGGMLAWERAGYPGVRPGR